MIPNLHEIFPFHFHWDFHFAGKQEGSSMKNIQIDLKKLSLASPKHTLNLKGDFKEKGLPLYDGNLSLSLVNYQDLIHDMVNYYNRWEVFLAQSHLKYSLPLINEKITDEVIQFLQFLSQSPKDKPNDLLIDLKVINTTDVSVGSHSLGEVIGEGMKLKHVIEQELNAAPSAPKEQPESL